ncbi:MAG: helix-turn-helix domain-containing protein [Archaeoglobaceae archaeon]
MVRLIMVKVHQEDCSNIKISERLKDSEIIITDVKDKGNFCRIYAEYLDDPQKTLNAIEHSGVQNIQLISKSKNEIQISYDITTTRAWKLFNSLGRVMYPLKVVEGAETFLIYIDEDEKKFTKLKNLKNEIEKMSGTEVIKIKEIDLKLLSKVFEEMEVLASISEALKDLTELQYSALRSAYIMGYYDFPRRKNLDDLASLHGISKNAFVKRLRSAERKIISAIFYPYKEKNSY